MSRVGDAAGIIVVHMRPGMLAEVVTVAPTLDALRALIDGGWLEVISIARPASQSLGIHALVDEEGALKGLPWNFDLPSGVPIVGPVVFSRVDETGEEVGFHSEETALAFAAVINKSRGGAR